MMGGWSVCSLVWVFIVMHACNGADLVIEVEENAVPELNCSETQTKVTSFLNATYSLFYMATGVNLPVTVTVILPADTCSQEEGLPGRHCGDASVVFVDRESLLLQYGLCGEEGLRLEYNLNSGEPEQFMLSLMQYLYGVFPERGYQDSPRFPLFYHSEGEAALNSCTNVPVQGNFSLGCLETQDCSESIYENQTDITSSLLFSSNKTLYPSISGVCDTETHNKRSPTLHNLICGQRSVREVIKSQEEGNFIPPSISFVTKKSMDTFFLLLDQGPEMRENNDFLWKIFRRGWAPFFNELEDEVRFTVKITNSSYDVQNITKNDRSDTFWENNIFSESLFHKDVPELPVFSMIKTYMELMEDLSFPPLVVVTASTQIPNDTDVQIVIDFIENNKIPVYVITYSTLDNIFLSKLVKYGEFFTVPCGGSLVENNFWSYMIFQNIKSKLFSQQNIEKVYKIPITDLPIESEYFELDSFDTQTTQGSLKFLSTLNQINSNQLKINLVSPTGAVYTTGPGITELWKGILEVNIDKDSNITGTWKIDMDSTSSDTAESDEYVYMIYHHTTSDRTQPSPWTSKYGDNSIVDGDITLVLPMYAMSTVPDLTNGIHRIIVYTASADNYTIVTMHDDGLLAPDIIGHDDIYSGYFYSLYSPGYHAFLYQATPISFNTSLMTPSYTSVGQSFYVSNPRNMSDEDDIPPARIADLRLVKIDAVKQKATIAFTEPGDDFMDNGAPSMYFIFCGNSMTNVTFVCDDISHRARFGEISKSVKQITLEINKFDQAVYVGIVAVDSAGNRGQLSNIIQIYAKDPNPTTTQQPSTTAEQETTSSEAVPSSTTVSEMTTQPTTSVTTVTSVTTTNNISESTAAPVMRGVSSVTFWSVTGTLIGLLVFVILGFCLFILCRTRRKGKERQEYGRNMQMQYRTESKSSRYDETGFDSSNRQSQDAKTVRFKSNLSSSRTLTKTNGSLNLELDTEDDSIPTSDHSSSTSEGGEANPGFSTDPSDSIIAYKVTPDNDRPRAGVGPDDPLYHISNDLRLNEVGIPQLYNTIKDHQVDPENQRCYDLARTSNLPQKEIIMQLNDQNLRTPNQRRAKPGPPTAPKPSITSQLMSRPATRTQVRNPSPSSTSSEEEPQGSTYRPTNDSLWSGNYHSQPVVDGEQKPFNYIAFSQYLYGEKPADQTQQTSRNVSFV